MMIYILSNISSLRCNENRAKEKYDIYKNMLYIFKSEYSTKISHVISVLFLMYMVYKDILLIFSLFFDGHMHIAFLCICILMHLSQRRIGSDSQSQNSYPYDMWFKTTQRRHNLSQCVIHDILSVIYVLIGPWDREYKYPPMPSLISMKHSRWRSDKPADLNIVPHIIAYLCWNCIKYLSAKLLTHTTK